MIADSRKKLNQRYYFQNIICKSLNRFFNCIGVDPFFLVRLFSVLNPDEAPLETRQVQSAAHSNQFGVDSVDKRLKARTFFALDNPKKRTVDDWSENAGNRLNDVFDLSIEMNNLRQIDERTRLVCKECSGMLSHVCQNYDCTTFFDRFRARSYLLTVQNKLKLVFEN